jgi:hypothetical protein
MGDRQHEALVQIEIYHRNPNNKIYEPVPEEERKDYLATPFTPADFSCASWIPHPDLPTSINRGGASETD